MLAVVSEPTEEIRRNCRLEGIQLVVNPHPSRGQISSLRCALQAVPEADGVVVLLVDQGWVESSTVADVREALGTARVAVARHGGRPGHPTGFQREIFSELESKRADVGAYKLIEEWKKAGSVSWVDVDDPGVLRNINTPDQYREFIEECGFNPR